MVTLCRPRWHFILASPLRDGQRDSPVGSPRADVVDARQAREPHGVSGERVQEQVPAAVLLVVAALEDEPVVA